MLSSLFFSCCMCVLLNWPWRRRRNDNENEVQKKLWKNFDAYSCVMRIKLALVNVNKKNEEFEWETALCRWQESSFTFLSRPKFHNDEIIS